MRWRSIEGRGALWGSSLRGSRSSTAPMSWMAAARSGRSAPTRRIARGVPSRGKTPCRRCGRPSTCALSPNARSSPSPRSSSAGPPPEAPPCRPASPAAPAYGPPLATRGPRGYRDVSARPIAVGRHPRALSAVSQPRRKAQCIGRDSATALLDLCDVDASQAGCKVGMRPSLDDAPAGDRA